MIITRSGFTQSSTPPVPPAWDPSQPLTDSGTAQWLWYREDYTAVGATIDQWTDKSGNGFHAVRFGGHPTPTPVVSANLGGQPCYEWSGFTSALGPSGSPGTGEFSLIFIYYIAPPTYQFAGQLWWGMNGPNLCGCQGYSGNNTPTITQNMNDFHSQLSITGAQILVFTMKAADASIRRNGVVLLSGANWSSIVPAWTYQILGNIWSYGNAFRGIMAEMIGYAGPITTADAVQIETYANTRYALGF